TSDVTIALKAAPMITATARSSTFPRAMNSRNSFSIHHLLHIQCFHLNASGRPQCATSGVHGFTGSLACVPGERLNSNGPSALLRPATSVDGRLGSLVTWLFCSMRLGCLGAGDD